MRVLRKNRFLMKGMQEVQLVKRENIRGDW